MPDNAPVNPQSLLVIARYPRYLAWAGLFSMAIFRLWLWRRPTLSFWKLLGTGRNGSFDLQPDWQRWGLLLVAHPDQPLQVHQPLESLLQTMAGKAVCGWLRLFGAQLQGFALQPVSGHGLWDGRQVFGPLSRQKDEELAPIGVLTRATIRLSRLRQFWRHVPAVSSQMAEAEGFVTSVGIGEAPFYRQATFSIWQSATHMKQFAYQQALHKEVVRKTHTEGWYSEELFARFALLQCWNNEAVQALLPNVHEFG